MRQVTTAEQDLEIAFREVPQSGVEPGLQGTFDASGEYSVEEPAEKVPSRLYNRLPNTREIGSQIASR